MILNIKQVLLNEIIEIHHLFDFVIVGYVCFYLKGDSSHGRSWKEMVEIYDKKFENLYYVP